MKPILRAGFFTALTVLSVLLCVSVAGAQAVDAPMEGQSWGVITLDAAVWSAVAGVVIPFVTGLVTKLSASSALKGFVTVCLAAIVATFNQVIIANDGHFEIKAAVIYFFVAFAAAQSSHAAIVRPNNVGAKLAPTKGIG